MQRPAVLALFSVCVMILAALRAEALAQTPTLEDLVRERPTYTTADELREACEPYLKPIDPQARKMPQFDEHLLFIVPHLDSEDAELRDAAVDILAQLLEVRRHIRSSAFTKYLSRDYPLNVRVVALAHSLYGFLGTGERYPKDWPADMEAAWTETLNDIAESPATPPHFDVLAFAMTFRRSCVALVKAENQPIMVRRLLAMVSDETRDDRERIMKLICRFPADASVDEMLAWYQEEQDASTRAVCVDHVASHSRSLTHIHGEPESDAKLKALMRFLELAAQDADPEIAKKAKESLERAEAFLEESKVIFQTPSEDE